ncbi:hypothetical protein [Mycoplasmopsis felis]|uniref:hypothetical protein n=1 Tax=Mycoplasmopsis felis TaxID=33923 RepID=UPI002AF6B1E8|nr:hypothetical protein [Mycoplasmopsis felis]WQQ01932.1 hypothetical protein RRG54_01060 [Mycoplasmopsis felis]WQQ05395.1 hypothetical protein RRG59_03535 [Mycoplasmopsis felis]WQQ08228.1 hypothetical protein RRG61_02755 [Mycoplasmopsis felis]WQQ09807.1 hypothetical protein RRG49_02395 [Mycoplasmopsis felis]WQQ09919.1 hypothetical protein RRG49_02975 [Mycoplasmopsis felis]
MKFENKFIIVGLVSSITYSKYNNMETKESEEMFVISVKQDKYFYNIVVFDKAVVKKSRELGLVKDSLVRLSGEIVYRKVKDENKFELSLKGHSIDLLFNE